MSETLVLAPVRLPAIMLGEIVVRLGLAALMGWVGWLDNETMVRVLCGLAALYHSAVAGRLAALLVPGAAALTVGPWGFTWRELWRDQRVSWSGVVGLAATVGRTRRPGVVVGLGDAKGETSRLILPDVFSFGRQELLAELQTRRCS
jgi:hypothetical protein